jgi:hypothetical protein
VASSSIAGGGIVSPAATFPARSVANHLTIERIGRDAVVEVQRDNLYTPPQSATFSCIELRIRNIDVQHWLWL